jgi:AcrR family transcriptional regulator
MPRSPKQFEDIRKQKKQLIMDTALELFAENGFHSTSISQIANKAGISKGLTYNYFKSKNDILVEIIDNGFNEMYNNLNINRDGILTKEEFIYFIKQNFKIIQDNISHWKLFFALLLQPKVATTFSIQYEEKAAPIFKLFYDFIEQQGSSNPEKDFIAIAAMLEGAFLYVVAAPNYFPQQKLEESVIQACFKIIEG